MDFNPEILERFFKGKYSRKDFLIVKSAFENADDQEQLKETLKKHWVDYNDELPTHQNVDYILRKIHHKIQTEEKRPGVNKYIAVFQRIAAILIIPLVLSFIAVLYYFSETSNSQVAYAEIHCPLGVQTKFVLPDGTTGFLNSGSYLKFPVNFKGDRTVTLKGEAFFDVKRDEEHPFIVNTTNLQTKVLGTQFNVIAYENEDSEEVILHEGKVEVYNNSGTILNTLKPNQQLVINTETSICKVSNVDSYQYVSWTEGKLIFRNESLQQVAKRLNRRYNVEIQIQDSELLKYSFRATFLNEPIEEVLKLLSKTAPIQFIEQNRIISTNNTYEKRKFIIGLDKKRLKYF